jgi:peptidoglycan/xylan/chitin deacetylase (PgdA/CDA1 family)
MRYVVKTNWWLRMMFPSSVTWEIENAENEVFLTFDDGPHPTITPFVLEQLNKYNAKGTFFCIGKNVQEFPEVYRQLIDNGHRVGNHTYNHLNGWKTNDKKYFENIGNAKKIIDSNLFRPPYGRITRFQANEMKSVFKIIMWDVLSADFDVEISPVECYENVVKNTKPGSIIVFHDSEKAFPRLEEALPKVLQNFFDKGYKMSVIR